MGTQTVPIRPLKVELVSWPVNPLGTLWYVWEQSRTKNELPSPEAVEHLLKTDYRNSVFITYLSPYYNEILKLAKPEEIEKVDGYNRINALSISERVRETVNKLIDEDIPCTENLNFVFAIENMPISLREQMVRHRIGVTIGDRIGADIVPEIAKSSWWSQTMRMLPMNALFSEGRFILPETLKGKSVVIKADEVSGKALQVSAEEYYYSMMYAIQNAYNKLTEAGVPMEDARQLIPIGVTHGITWSLNLKSAMHILGKRACWVAQANLWESLIAGMVDELCTKVSPIFRKIVSPPCMKGGKYVSCPYKQIQEERFQGRDHMPPCPLYTYHETEEAITFSRSIVGGTWGIDPTFVDAEVADITNWNCSEPVERQMLLDNIQRFQKMWKLNVFTGEPLNADQN